MFFYFWGHPRYKEFKNVLVGGKQANILLKMGRVQKMRWKLRKFLPRKRHKKVVLS